MSVCHGPTSVPGTVHPVVLVTDTVLPCRGPVLVGKSDHEQVISRIICGDFPGGAVV